MKLHFLLLTFILIVSACSTPQSSSSEEMGALQEEVDKKAILKVMKAQEIAWSENDLEGFMEGYWKSDSLKFFGKSGLTKGWEQTLANYKKGYPTADHSGTLNFTTIDISRIGDDSYWVMGEYALRRPVGDANGVFMIIFKRIQGEWKIIGDMSCG
ncbi:MAG: nuclear transport factor 2 family protein [Flavobacteriaceae bacterium]|nr:nuclear transport factor 2 family protein [Flavobacteriaceae bacterium]